ncbi:MAG: hypothetical protein ACI4WR_00290 [Bulleidia sp.]
MFSEVSPAASSEEKTEEFPVLSLDSPAESSEPVCPCEPAAVSAAGGAEFSVFSSASTPASSPPDISARIIASTFIFFIFFKLSPLFWIIFT